jgi:pimeloyl-ACP methyl ester carboxylesterase
MTVGAVVIVPGLGGTARDWDAVLALLPPDLPVTVVDVGPPPRPRPRRDWWPDVVAGRLRRALVGMPTPWLLVGHSAGALQVQALLYADAASCAGAVLVDGSHARSVRLVAPPAAVLGQWCARAAIALGAARLLGPAARRLSVRLASARRRDPLGRAEVRAVYGSRAWALTTLDAWCGHGTLQAGVLAWQDARGAPGPPVRLLVGAAGERPASGWLALQHDLARRLGAPAPTLLADAAHLVPLDRPDAVAVAICALLPAPVTDTPCARSRGE